MVLSSGSFDSMLPECHIGENALHVIDGCKLLPSMTDFDDRLVRYVE